MGKNVGRTKHGGNKNIKTLENGQKLDKRRMRIFIFISLPIAVGESCSPCAETTL